MSLAPHRSTPIGHRGCLPAGCNLYLAPSAVVLSTTSPRSPLPPSLPPARHPSPTSTEHLAAHFTAVVSSIHRHPAPSTKLVGLIRPFATSLLADPLELRGNHTCSTPHLATVLGISVNTHVHASRRILTSFAHKQTHRPQPPAREHTTQTNPALTGRHAA